MEHQTTIVKGLPENAYRELEPGETYEPIIPADKVIHEITTRSVVIGLLMALIFSGAAAFLGLKIATVFEAAIPIAILAVGLSNLFPRRSTILENVIIQSIGAASGVVVAGAIFTLPALFILQKEFPQITIDFLRIFLVSLFGGFLGILFLIFFRKYFVSDMHGKFPFPEATATTEVLVAGEEGGKQAKVLVVSMLIAAAYDFCIHTLEVWREVFSTQVFGWGRYLSEKARLVFKIDVTAAIFGMGYIVGLKYASIICAGSFLTWFVFIPLIAHFGQYLTVPIPPVTDGKLIGEMTAEEIFRNYARLIGIGGIACAGIIGILKSSGIIYQAFTLGFKEMLQKKSAVSTSVEVPRTGKDLKMSNVLLFILLIAIAIFIFFRWGVVAGMDEATKLAVIGLLVVMIISFLFTSVAARAIAIVGTNPVSGMTLMTLILSSLILLKAGLSGPAGMVAALLIGGVVCTSLSMSGGFITDLKIGYWIGATPVNQQRFKFLGTLVSALAVAAVMILLSQTYGFVADATHPAEKVLPAPQANAMAAVIFTLMSRQTVPWLLYGVGILLSLILELIGIPPLAFALGVYIPLELNTPILAGGLMGHLIARSSADQKISKARSDRGTLIASGYIAGGAIIGVVSALIKFVNEGYIHRDLSLHLAEKPTGEWLSIAMLILLAVFTYWYAKKDTGSKE